MGHSRFSVFGAGRFGPLLGPAIAGSIVLAATALHSTARFEAFGHDLLLQIVPPAIARHVTVVAIDERSLEREGPWPWPRARLAALVSRIAGSGAPVVGIDLLLHDTQPGDAALASACRRTPCVVATTLDEQKKWILPAASLGPDVHPGHAAFELDDDGILRRVSITKQDRETSLPAFAVQLAALASGSSIAAGRAVTPGFRTPPSTLPVISATDVLRTGGVLLAPLRGRVVVIGTTAVALGDRVMTPRSRQHTTDAGVLVHASAAESLLSGDTFREVSPLVSALIAVALVWGAVRIGRWHDARWRAGGEAVLVLAPAAGAAALVFMHTFIPVTTLSAPVVITIIAGEARRGLQLMRHGRAAAETLERDLGPQISDGAAVDVGLRLEALASAIVRRRVSDVESRRVLAHELKTPLTAMRSMSQLLIGYDLTPEERQRVAALLGDEAEKLQEMITNLLEIEQLALRGRADSTVPVDLGTVIASRVAFVARGVSRPIDVTIEENVRIPGDPALIERIIDNLVGNAVKYSQPPHPVSVAIRRDGGTAVVDVLDRGPGVPAGERERVFRSFARGTTSEGTDGLGLGLALVAEAVRWHRGAIEVLDREGGGSIFRVRFPGIVADAVAEAV
jgi:signal transduction histidine kinase